jgi:hypothetical protein
MWCCDDCWTKTNVTPIGSDEIGTISMRTKGIVIGFVLSCFYFTYVRKSKPLSTVHQ